MALRILRSRALLALRRDEDAHRALRACLRIDPTSSDAYRLLGELALRQGEPGTAEVFTRKALSLNPSDLHTRQMLATITSLNRSNNTPTPPRMARGTHGEEFGAARSALFGHYLVALGALTESQLRQVVLHHRTMGVRVGEAAVALGFVPQQRVDAAARAYHAGIKAS